MSTSGRPVEWRATNTTELGRTLARVRKTTGLGQEEMAERVGVHRSYLSRMENGLSTEQIQRLFAILRESGYEIVLRPRAKRDG
ncbi:MAG: helix-turn-helix domain-containing protein [Acidimicrobiales bacterium]